MRRWLCPRLHSRGCRQVSGCREFVAMPWTLPATYGSWSMSLGGRTKRSPIGVINIGPVRTLHNPDGSPAADFFWFEPDYAGDVALFKPKPNWESLEKQRRWASRKLLHSPYQGDLKRLIIRFVGGLDKPDLDVAFLQMWSVLENVTDTVGDSYDKTIDRATWIFEDRKIAKELLTQLRLHRNQFVHAARSTGDRDQIVYMVKSFVEPHLVRLINNDFRVASIQEYGEFLSLPTNVETLRKRRAMLAHALAMRS